MTLKQAKDKIAKKHGYKSFKAMEENGFGIGTGELLSFADEAAELYAREKWKEACNETRLDDGAFIFSGAPPPQISERFYPRRKIKFIP